MARRLALTAIMAAATLSGLTPSVLSAQTDAPAEQNVALQQIDPDAAVLVLVDYTSGLYPVVDTIETDEMLNNAVAAAKIAQTFGVPILVLGDEGGFYGQMHPPIKALVGDDGHIHLRTTPSAWASGTFREALEATGRTQVIIGGISTDNCTLLTSLDLLRAGYDVYVMIDISGTDSRQSEEAAILRLRDAGASTVSWIMFGSELLSDWRTPEGAALGAIYAAHINGPNSGPLGNSIEISEIGGATEPQE
jgi:nicotinamidase-related amidase